MLCDWRKYSPYMYVNSYHWKRWQYAGESLAIKNLDIHLREDTESVFHLSVLKQNLDTFHEISPSVL